MIREATMNDMPELMRMARSFHFAANGKRFIRFEDNTDGWVGWFRDCIADPGRTCLIAEDDGPCGFITALTGPLLFAPGKTKMAYEGNLWVDEAARTNGHARHLIQAAKDWAKANGCSHLTMAAHRFFGFKGPDKLYRSMGFELEEKHYLGAVQ